MIFEFKYISRIFQFKAESEFEAEHWVICLQFLQNNFEQKQFRQRADIFAAELSSQRTSVQGSDRFPRRAVTERDRAMSQSLGPVSGAGGLGEEGEGEEEGAEDDSKSG